MASRDLSPFAIQCPYRARKPADVHAVAVAAGGCQEGLGPAQSRTTLAQDGAALGDRSTGRQTS
jgi:hypothetical protein